MIIIALLLYFLGIISLILNRFHLIIILLRLEFLYISTIVLMFFYFSCTNFLNIFVFLARIVCEAALGLRLLVILNYFYGNEIINSFRLIKC
uniref:NADH dehydrogenase subunit 4L n=1 Tax=Amblyomma variegatum TaxID=34610 RepID=F0JAB2_AMBVA|nr:TPA_inf: NADH dehydrogenase subunit 4L [Amblyomma variegatum]